MSSFDQIFRQQSVRGKSLVNHCYSSKYQVKRKREERSVQQYEKLQKKIVLDQPQQQYKIISRLQVPNPDESTLNSTLIFFQNFSAQNSEQRQNCETTLTLNMLQQELDQIGQNPFFEEDEIFELAHLLDSFQTRKNENPYRNQTIHHLNIDNNFSQNSHKKMQEDLEDKHFSINLDDDDGMSEEPSYCPYEIIKEKPIDDQIVNNYIDILNKVAYNTVVFQSWNIQVSVQSNFTDNQALTSQFNRKIHPETETLIFPLNKKNHWNFVALDLKNRVFSLYDSIRKPDPLRNPFFKGFLDFVQEYFECIFRFKVPTFPQQNNSYDCGLYMLLGIRKLITGINPHFHQKHAVRFWQQIQKELYYGKFELEQIRY